MTLDLASELESIRFKETVLLSHNGEFSPEVKISDAQFNYPENRVSAIRAVNLEVRRGDVVALVGPSGAGKTTLVDLILGVLTPSAGEVTISGVRPNDAVKIWPGKIAYVPQETVIANTTIRSNIALGVDERDISDEKLKRAIEIAHLSAFIESLPLGVETHVGENGARLSGGQRQRIGIARALYSNPQLIVLDEATSALDGETESNISEAINDLRGQVTLIIVAHRLSTVRAADTIYYLEQGQVIASGTFEELRLKVKDFDTQAKLMGL
jgi:ABC-type multidrug transport system fused ATPase/permease subunit